MKKIIVIGCPGSGKSTFSKELHQKTAIPLYHLDMLFWNADKTTVGKGCFTKKLSEILKTDRWIVDGNYASTMEWRMQACDTVIFLDYPTQVCLEGVRARKGKKRSDLPWIEPDDDDADFLAFIKNFSTQNRPQVMDLLRKYAEKNIFIFTERSEAKSFLSHL